jgi:hypothetical protein
MFSLFSPSHKRIHLLTLKGADSLAIFPDFPKKPKIFPMQHFHILLSAPLFLLFLGVPLLRIFEKSFGKIAKQKEKKVVLEKGKGGRAF